MSNKELVKIRSEIIDDLAKVSERWGLSRILGRIYGTLIFSNKPMGLDEIAKRSGYSKSSVSQSMKLLENIGNTKRTKVPGSKKILFEVERDITNCIKKYLESTLNFEIIPMLGNIDRTEAHYKKLLEKTEDEETQKEIEEDLIKLKELKKSYNTAKQFLTIAKEHHKLMKEHHNLTKLGE